MLLTAPVQSITVQSVDQLGIAPELSQLPFHQTILSSPESIGSAEVRKEGIVPFAASEKIAMGTQEASKKASQPQLVKFGKAFKLAEQWVANMSKLEEDEKSTKVKLESRPPRLGIGAAVPHETRVVRSNDPVERKLRAKLDVNRRKVVKNAEESTLSAKDGNSYQDSDEEEESRTQAFTKKRLSMTSFLAANKKQK